MHLITATYFLSLCMSCSLSTVLHLAPSLPPTHTNAAHICFFLKALVTLLEEGRIRCAAKDVHWRKNTHHGTAFRRKILICGNIVRSSWRGQRSVAQSAEVTLMKSKPLHTHQWWQARLPDTGCKHFLI